MGINRGFSVARRWETVYRSTPLSALPWEEGKPSTGLVELVESGMVEKGAVLDVCCGSGSNAVYLASNGFECYGIDISPTAIGYARERAVRAGATCDFVTGNVTTMPYMEDTFVLVFDRGCFHSLQPAERQGYSRGILRVLKPGGKYLLQCFSSRDHLHGPPYGFSPIDIEHLFSGLFKIHHIDEYSAGKESSPNYFLSVLMEKAENKNH
jgi:ubiquinone/menaquinone biosynthesis C-methylase UbiE